MKFPLNFLVSTDSYNFFSFTYRSPAHGRKYFEITANNDCFEKET